ncbi:MAG: hypothetical protein ACE5GO_08095 [Anaerolineales bacterium]
MLDTWEQHILHRLRKVYSSSGVQERVHKYTTVMVLPERVLRRPVKRVRRLSLYWVFVLFIAIAGILVTASFLWGNPSESPMGDSYIHFVYARNLVKYGELTFNPGWEEGIGTTSFLWVLLLAGFQLFGVAPVVGAKILGIGLLITCGVVAFDLLAFVLPLRDFRTRLLIAFLGALLLVLPGNFVWIALSGMETTLFTALGLLALNLYLRERWLPLGAVTGLLALTRSEGAALAGVIVAVEWLRRRKLGGWAFQVLIPMLVLLIPWLIFLQFRGGAPVPTSYYGKQVAFVETQRVIGDWNALASWTFQFSPVIYFFSWLGYVLLYLTGSISLPGPRIQIAGPLGSEQYSIPIVAFALNTLVLLAFGSLVLRRLWAGRSRFSLQVPAHRLLLVFVVWAAAHNLLYALFLAIPGSAGRYVPMNHILLWEILLAGVLIIRQHWKKGIAFGFVLGLVAISIYYWHGVYQSNIEYMLKVRIPAARYIDQHLPEDAPIAAVDLGPARYYARQPVVDLFGFVNKDVLAYRNAGKSYSQYLADKEIKYLLTFAGSREGDAQLTNFAQQAGLYKDPALQLEEMASFAVTFDEWAFGSAPISNYLPSLVILRVVWTESPE